MASAGQNPPNDDAPKQEDQDKDRDSDMAIKESKENTTDSLANSTSSLSEQTSSSSPRNLKRVSTTPLLGSTASSTTVSPRASREGSPVRSFMKSGVAPAPRVPNRSRRNSSDLSPHRAPSAPNPNIPTVPSAAAIQRALSAAGTPHLPPPTSHDATIDSPRPSKVGRTATSSGSRTGPSNSRVNSPPPAASLRASKTTLSAPRTLDRPQSTPTTPTIVVERPDRDFTATNISNDSEFADEEHHPKSGMRTPGRGASGSGPALDVIRESSLPSTPAAGTTRSATGGKNSERERPEVIEENPMEDALSMVTKSKPVESGNESAGNKSGDMKSGDDGKAKKSASVAKAPTMQSKKSFTQLPLKGKAPGEGSVKNMTVETETVSSIPQVALGGGAIERNLANRTDIGGTLHLKHSSETIRPKKEKKKTVRKAPSVNAGTASSKADIFEAKVASAVSKADSSDSDETFVYESNPPEPHSARPHRMHSRTPSAASTVSQLDYHKGRQDGHHTVVGKKSMKFANNYNSIGYANEGEGTVRGPSQTGRGNTSHHHIGRYGRGGHASLFDNESPFPNAKRNVTGHLSNASPRQSPRSGHFSKVNGGSRKAEEVLSYDLEGEGADDERTPLIGSIRTARNRRRPLPGSVRQMYASDERGSSLCGRVAGYTLLGSVLAILIAAIIVILIVCTKPLINVHIQDIRNVLASEQEIMLDLHVHAINPNLIAIQVSDLDVNIFAKSKHVSTAAEWRGAQPSKPSSLLPPTTQPILSTRRSLNSILDDPADIISHLFDGGVDEGTDPIDDPASDSQTMLLGRIFSFDSPLVFEPSPIQQESKGSVGEVRLAKPGNRTEEGGSQRWEQVIQHDFELIVRGVLQYSSPISQMARSISIAGSVTVHPSQEDKTGNARTSTPDKEKEISPGSSVTLKGPGRQELQARWFAA